MIDPKTGCLALSETLRFNAGDTLEQIKILCLAANQTIADRQTGWQWLTVKNLWVDEQYYILSFGFQADALKQIQLIVSQNSFDLTANWDDWSEANERSVLTELRIWVVKQLGREGAFNWGDIWVAYDPKSGSSAVTLTYK